MKISENFDNILSTSGCSITAPILIVENLEAYTAIHTQEKPKPKPKKPIIYSMSKSAVKVRKFRAERGIVKVTCKCGIEVNKDGLSEHMRTNRHFNLLAELEGKKSPLV